MTHAEAVETMLAWASGNRSHTNEFMRAESDPAHRSQTLAAIAVADAAEVVMWSAVARAIAPANSHSGASE